VNDVTIYKNSVMISAVSWHTFMELKDR